MTDFNDVTAAPPPPSGTPSQDERTLALLTHLSGILLGFIVPLIIWLVEKDKQRPRPFIVDQAKEALNFQITIAIAVVACVILSFIGIGFLLTPIVWLVNLVFCILAGVKASEGVATVIRSPCAWSNSASVRVMQRTRAICRPCPVLRPLQRAAA